MSAIVDDDLDTAVQLTTFRTLVARNRHRLAESTHGEHPLAAQRTQLLRGGERVREPRIVLAAIDGDDPPVVRREPADRRRTDPAPGARDERDPLPAPALRVPAQSNIYMMGIGGTGVVTVNQILGTAALLDGKHVRGLDQTGLSQKGGPVVSHLKLADAPHEVSNKIGAGEADCYLGLDILVATSPVNLDHARPDRTIAVLSTSKVPTGAMVTHTDVPFPEPAVGAAAARSAAAGTRKTRAATAQAQAPATMNDAPMPAQAAVPSRSGGAMALPAKPANVCTENARPMRGSEMVALRIA